MSEEYRGVWIAYHSDWSGFVVFRTEIEALRHAVDFSMHVMLLPWGKRPQDALEDQRTAERTAASMTKVAGL